MTTQKSIDAVMEILEWANAVYGDPLTLTHILPAQLNLTGTFSAEHEVALYLDWQTRDTEIGYKLLESQRERLIAAVAAYGTAMMERRRSMALTKVRLDSLEQINVAEPNPSLRYAPKVIKAVRREYNKVLREVQYLKRFFLSMDALDQLLGATVSTGQPWTGDWSEQRFRLLGQAGRGQLRVVGFRQRFSWAHYTLPETVTIGTMMGVLIGQAAVSPGGATADILIDPEVGQYLLHCLETINLLATVIERELQTPVRLAYSDTGWPSIMILLRAIVELFQYCNFEMMHVSSHLLIDPDAPNKLLVFRTDRQQWQTVDEQPGDRLRREAAAAARLLCLPPTLLACQQLEDIDRMLKRSKELPRVNAAKYFEAYLSAGLAQLEVGDASSNKYHVAHNFVGRVLTRVIEQSPTLQQRLHSELGGPLETLTAMALLDSRLLRGSNGQVLPESDRLHWLARFWKTMGKRRQSSLLGRQYHKEIDAIMEQLGESAPERSGHLSMVLTTMLTRTGGRFLSDTDIGKEEITDLLAGLVLTDQVRIVGLLNVTWDFASQLLSPLQTALDPQDFEAVLNSLHTTVIDREGEIALCFNPKWIQAHTAIWRLLRTVAPHGWHFWTLLIDKAGWSKVAQQTSPEDALGLLLRAFGDVVRLKLLFEVCSPRTIEHMQVEAEVAARLLLGVLSRALMLGGMISDTVAETFSYYYDQSMLHDAGLAFAGSFISYLSAMEADLEKNDKNHPLHSLLTAVIEFLEVHFPGARASTRERTTTGDTSMATIITLGGAGAAHLEINAEGEILVSKDGTVIHLQRNEWLELVRQIKAGTLATLA
ncbi:MAG: hypothetical protein AB1489_05745 [Acidobacteriota bacterium]